VVAVSVPGRALSVAWCGDSRAYLWRGGTVERLTRDHNRRRVDGGPKNIITSALGCTDTDAELRQAVGHPTMEAVRRDLSPYRWARLLLVSDGAYEPLEESCVDLADRLVGAVEDVPDAITAEAVDLAGYRPDNASAVVADLFHGIHY
jgi:serine/threonine protein phosphatase PrpC